MSLPTYSTSLAAKLYFADLNLQLQINAVADKTEVGINGSFHGGSKLDALQLALEAGKDTVPELVLADTDVVQILYTSGTTSDPKGAMHTHRSLMTHYGACQDHLEIRPADRSLAALPLYHSAQMHVFTMPTLLSGGYSRMINTPTPDAILGLLASEQVKTVFLHHLPSGSRYRATLSSIQRSCSTWINSTTAHPSCPSK